MPDEVILDVTTIEENVTVETTAGDVVEIQVVAPTGTAATVAVGTTTTGAAGTNASVTNSGTTSAAVFNFTIPRGDTGETGATGATGAAGPNSVTIATTSDGTGQIMLDTLAVGTCNITDEVVFDNLAFTYGTGAAAAHRTALGVSASGDTVLKSAYTPAHSLLVQQSGTGSPTSLSVGNNTILGRASGGGSNIAALSGSDARTVLGLSTLATTTPAVNVATFLETPTSANLAAAVTGETGSGALVFGTSPTLTTPVLGAASGTTLTLGTTLPSGTILNCYSSGTSMNNVWRGRLTAGGDTARFLMGEINGQAWLGAHNAALNAWSDFYINPDGGAKVGIGDMSGGVGNVAVPLMMVSNASLSVGIGTGNGAINGSAILEIVSTSRGFLPPRMTTAQRNAIGSAAAGLMVYNTTTNKLNFYNGSAWEAVTSL